MEVAEQQNNNSDQQTMVKRKIYDGDTILKIIRMTAHVINLSITEMEFFDKFPI